MFLTYEENILSCKKKVSEENGIGSYVSWIHKNTECVRKSVCRMAYLFDFLMTRTSCFIVFMFLFFFMLKKYKYLQNDSFARMMAQINSTLRIFIAVYRWFTSAFIRFIRRKKGLLKYIMVYQWFTMVYQHF